MEMMKELMREIKELKVSNKEYQEEVLNIAKENDYLKKQVKSLETRLENMDKHSRQNNVIITGMSMRNDDPQQMRIEMKESLKRYLEVETEIKKVTQINRRIFRVELEHKLEKEKIMKNKNKLRKLKQGKIFIDNDLTVLERKIQKHIRDEAKKHKNNGKNVKIGYQKLIVGDEIFAWDIEKEKLVKHSKGNERKPTSKN